MYALFVPLVGAILTVQNSLNSVLAGRAGNYLSLLAIHLSGLIPLCAIVILRKEKGTGEKLPFYYYGGGFIGVGTVLACTMAFARLGASLAVAIALLGQMLGSILLDATGFLGRKRFPPSSRSLPGIALALAGIFVIAGSWEGRLGYMAIAFASGVLPLLSFTLNSQLALAKGIFRSTWVNYAVGLASSLVLVALLRPDLGPSLSALRSTPLVFVVGGGLLGVVMVAAMNFVFPKIPALWSTLLMFAGQALTGVLVDAVVQGSFSGRKLIGTLVVLAGMAVNAFLDKRGEARART